jgi:hypothetical protein
MLDTAVRFEEIWPASIALGANAIFG